MAISQGSIRDVIVPPITPSTIETITARDGEHFLDFVSATGQLMGFVGPSGVLNGLVVSALSLASTIGGPPSVTLVAGGGVLVQPQTNAPAPFQVKDAAGTVLFTASDSGIAAPGTGTTSNRFGSNTLAGGNNSVALGDAASTTSGATNGSALGPSSSVNGVNGTAVGQGSTAFTSTTSAGQNSGNASSTQSVFIGQSAGTGIAFNGVIAIGYGALPTAAAQCVIGSVTTPMTDVYFGNGPGQAIPSAYTLHGSGASGANIAGSNLALAGGQSTGTGKGGDVLIQTSPAGGAGSTLNTLVTLAQFTGDSKIGFFAVTPVVQQANASSAGVSGIVAGAAYAQADMVAVKAALTAIRAGLAANGLLANTA